MIEAKWYKSSNPKKMYMLRDSDTPVADVVAIMKLKWYEGEEKPSLWRRMYKLMVL